MLSDIFNNYRSSRGCVGCPSMNDVLLLKTDANGKEQWHKTFGGSGDDNAHTVIVNRKNDIVLTGYGDYWGHAGKMDMFLKQISSEGEDIWTQTYGGAENDRAMTVFQLQPTPCGQ